MSLPGNVASSELHVSAGFIYSGSLSSEDEKPVRSFFFFKCLYGRRDLMSVFLLIPCTCCFYCSSVSIFRLRQTSELALSSSGMACRFFLTDSQLTAIPRWFRLILHISCPRQSRPLRQYLNINSSELLQSFTRLLGKLECCVIGLNCAQDTGTSCDWPEMPFCLPFS